MSNELTVAQGGLITYIHNEERAELPMPFEREIFLFDTYIAGTSHIPELHDGSITLEKGEKLDFFREPDNLYDKNAIAMRNRDRQKIGYVPREDNVVFSRLMDAGKELYGKITAIETRGTLLKIRVKIFLKD